MCVCSVLGDECVYSVLSVLSPGAPLLFHTGSHHCSSPEFHTDRSSASAPIRARALQPADQSARTVLACFSLFSGSKESSVFLLKDILTPN